MPRDPACRYRTVRATRYRRLSVRARPARAMFVGVELVLFVPPPLPPARRNATYYPFARPRLLRGSLVVVTRLAGAARSSSRSPLLDHLAVDLSPKTRGLRGDRTPAKCQLGAHSSLSLSFFSLFPCLLPSVMLAGGLGERSRWKSRSSLTLPNSNRGANVSGKSLSILR